MKYAKDKAINVISIPSWEVAEELSPDIANWKQRSRDSNVISVEAGVTLGWSKYADRWIGIDRFGASAPGDEVMDSLGVNETTIDREVKEGGI